MAEEITFGECCRIILEDWKWRRDGIATELRDYKRELLALLNREFGIEWRDEAQLESARRQGLPLIALTMPKDFAAIASPFARWLEYSFAPGEREIIELHREFLRSAESAHRERWVALFRDLLLLRWPEAAQRSSSWTRLRSLGLGEPVDEMDFL
jgi:hypothetical protein